MFVILVGKIFLNGFLIDMLFRCMIVFVLVISVLMVFVLVRLYGVSFLLVCVLLRFDILDKCKKLVYLGRCLCSILLRLLFVLVSSRWW